MSHFLYEAGLWILVIVECFFALIMLAFFIFGGRIRWSIELNGPMRFMSAKNHEDDTEGKRSE
ncbi:hypothetical protein N007_05650 [Alicyclobacillus acidoterrestris ATCC 49025]|nr:hypothetical protein N007_05650 [Alicyclobacillus acidoterrestris ATCC 49025]